MNSAAMAPTGAGAASHLDVDAVKVGDVLPEHVQGPISRATLALFAGASNDHVLLHIDSDFAKDAGMPDVFAHGMLSMAYVAQFISRWIGQDRVREWGVRFTAMTPLYASVRCSGEIIEIFDCDGERRARVKIRACTGDGILTLDGDAVVALGDINAVGEPNSEEA